MGSRDQAIACAPRPTVGVEDVLAWPFPGVQARQVQEVARSAGGATSCCRVPPHLLSWGNSAAWEASLRELVSRALTELGVEVATKATLAGLELQQASDSQGNSSSLSPSWQMGPEVAGAWGSLVIELPALRDGGGLAVSHCGETERFDFSGAAAALTSHWVASYGVCERQLQPLTSGRLLSLTYALSRASGGPSPQPPSQAAASRRFEQLERRWVFDVSTAGV